MEEKRRLPIGEEEVRKMETRLQEYKDKKQSFNERIIQNEKWWELKHWEVINKGINNKKEPEPKSAWIVNSLMNKHADYMDNFPEPNILPREESDKDTADILGPVIKCILDRSKYKKRYSAASWDKVKSGPGLYAVLWDPYKDGIGDIVIKNANILNLYWKPGVEDIQDSPHLFYQYLMSNEELEEAYPEMKGKTGSGNAEIAKYQTENEDEAHENSVVTDWYYKKTRVKRDKNGVVFVEKLVHFAKVCNGVLLYATENDPNKQNGIYNHGKYPFVIDVYLPVKESPAGMGFIDLMKDAQMYIDKMQNSILKNTIIGSKSRYMCKDSAGVNEDEFANLNKDIIHYSGSPDGIIPIEHKPLDSVYVTVMQNKIEELKETSGNRDFSQGATTSGVTAASAIAALQEAGGKVSRDMIDGTYDVCEEITYMAIELIRQFYDVPRIFRITGDNGETKFIEFSNAKLKPEPTGKDFDVLVGGRKPYFDIKVSAQKASPFTKIAQNELAKELYNLGFFNPQFADQALMCIDMMYFDGKEEIRRKISENGTLYQQLLAMQQQMAQMATLIAKTTGDTRLVDAVSQNGITAQGVPSGKKEEKNVDEFGTVTKEEMNSTAGKARAKAAAAATPKV